MTPTPATAPTALPDAPTGRRRHGIVVRLMVAQALVLGAGALTSWLVASAVGPGIFQDHLARAGDTHTAAERVHIREAFATALLVSVAVALLAAAAAALAVSWYFSRRMQRSIGTVTAAAAEIAAGRFDTRVPEPGLGHEFHTLTEGYNSLAARLEAVESTRRGMLGDLAHEMRTPLATIEAHLEAVEDGVRQLDPDTMGVLRDATHRLGRLAADLGAISRAEEGNLDIHLRDVDAADVAMTAVEAAADRFATKGIRLDTRLTRGSTVHADPDRLGQVLTNLLDNALRHTPPGGTVVVACEPVHSAGATWVQYTVTDTGAGIAAEHVPFLFDRFYRVDSARNRHDGGSGIGLAIAKALVEAHGGTVSAHSDGPGTGATFTVQLPVRTQLRRPASR